MVKTRQDEEYQPKVIWKMKQECENSKIGIKIQEKTWLSFQD